MKTNNFKIYFSFSDYLLAESIVASPACIWMGDRFESVTVKKQNRSFDHENEIFMLLHMDIFQIVEVILCDTFQALKINTFLAERCSKQEATV